MKSKAAFIVGAGNAEIREIDVPDPRSDEVQVQCIANGICMGEVSQFTGAESVSGPIMMGHEGIGIVTKAGHEADGLREGDMVTCLKWAHHLNYKANQVSKFSIPPSNPSVTLTEPVSCIVAAIASYDITPGDRVLVLGAGYMGLLNVQGLAHCPLAELVVADIKSRNLELATCFGATQTVQVFPEDLRALDAFERSFDLVVEAAGAVETLQRSASYVRTGGRLSVFAWHHQPRPVDFGEWHAKGLTVLNSSPMIATDYTANIMARAVRLMERGLFDQRKLITHRHDFTDVQEAMELATERPMDYIKGVLLFAQ